MAMDIPTLLEAPMKRLLKYKELLTVILPFLRVPTCFVANSS
jgi:hypothetical protein